LLDINDECNLPSMVDIERLLREIAAAEEGNVLDGEVKQDLVRAQSFDLGYAETNVEVGVDRRVHQPGAADLGEGDR
jgi:hypothetical protein